MRRALPLAACLLAGCSLAPAYERPAAPVQAQWPGDAAALADQAGLPAADYRTLFRDPRLIALIDIALENNRDLRQAAANVARARAQFRIQRADLFPQLDAGADVVRGNQAGGETRTTATADLSVTAYEIDLFGRIRSLTDAARENYLATAADAQAVRLALIGDIAQAWLTHAADASLLEISRLTAETAQRTEALTQARLASGIAPRSDLRQAQTILATAQSDMARYTTAIAQDRNLLALLVGAPVDPALLPGGIEEAGETIDAPLPGTSSEVLLRRPDIMAAEHDLRAANAQIGAARAALFPRVTLGALFGLVGSSLDGLFGSGGTQLQQGAAGITWPIFQGGAARAGVAASQAQRDALLAAYEKAIQTAYREVADALARQATIDDQLGADRLRVQASEDAAYLVDARYRGGIDSFLAALDAQRSLYTARRTLVASLLEAAGNRVTLYRALGGEMMPAPPAP
ncbi:efflux pump outer membrane protein [Sphingobium sp. SYK-6]|uniref:efflux transporter outer membrane subunit n=1 Tax=Sphingobium sp. (strain NBRC 103272 / SYK-6) TaxID=627192 RepID=UPI0002276E86|nr:efflux transporter outer membrane subunit [Sphingobium sp. SYK-6]BAK65053.1 efflux pump outer membrane protein [Sphingobium sp. SYK-6]